MLDFSSKIAERMKKVNASAIREIFKVANSPDIISFAGGVPAPEIYPIADIRKICDDIMDNDPIPALRYGISEGYDPLRDSLWLRMKKVFDIDRGDNDMLIVTGSQQGMDLITKALINPGDGIVCEEPSFIGSLNTFRTYEAKLYGVPIDDDGMNMEKLEQTLKEYKNIKFIYTIPTFQNPSGVTMSLEKRKKMLALAEKYDVLILEDNPYGELRFAGEYVPPIKSLDNSERVMYVGSFSKVFSPGFRLAYVIYDKGLTGKIVIGKQATDVHANAFAQMIAAKYITEYDLEKPIEISKELYEKRCSLMIKCMEEYFPDGVKFTRPDGGIFLWVTMPEGIDTLKLLPKAIEKKVAFVPGNTFMTDIEKPCNSMRLNFSTMPEKKIIEGMKILGDLFKRELGE